MRVIDTVYTTAENMDALEAAAALGGDDALTTLAIEMAGPYAAQLIRQVRERMRNIPKEVEVVVGNIIEAYAPTKPYQARAVAAHVKAAVEVFVRLGDIQDLSVEVLDRSNWSVLALILLRVSWVCRYPWGHPEAGLIGRWCLEVSV